MSEDDNRLLPCGLRPGEVDEMACAAYAEQGLVEEWDSLVPHIKARWRRSIIAAWNRRASGWQPIETAPRDAMLLLCHTEDTAPLIGYWGWGAWRENNGKGTVLRPTHWQPLPAAPEARHD